MTENKTYETTTAEKKTYEIPVNRVSILTPAPAGYESDSRFSKTFEVGYAPAWMQPTPKTDAALSGAAGLCEDCLDLYGWDHEILMLAEETGELIQAAMKANRCRKDGDAAEIAKAIDHLAEEMADVRVMLAQLAVMYAGDDMDSRIADWVSYKLERQAGRNAKRREQSR